MAYCGATDIRRALTGSSQAGRDPVADPTNTAADLDDEALNDSAAEASAIVDSYIDGPYDVTVDDIPDIIKYWTRDIASYYATLVWRKGKAPAPDNPVTLRFQNAVEMLKGVASGEITLDGPGNVDDQPTLVGSALQVPNIPQGLFPPHDFDLTGRWEGGSGSWPLHFALGRVFFSEEDAEDA
jgi:phage gp36-like protein